MTEMCMKCGVNQAYNSMHIYMHTSDSRVTACLHAPDVFMELGSDPNDRCVHENVQLVNCLTQCTFTCTSQTLVSLHIYMHLMCACKRALIRLSDVFM